MNDPMKKAAMHELTKRINKIASRESFFSLILEAESALAQAQAELGIISKETADAISAKAHLECVDIEEYDELYEKYMHPLVPVVKLLQRAVGGTEGQFVHYACTTGDILQTVYNMQMKQVWIEIKQSAMRLQDMLSEMALKYADTVMVGRTHNIQALPITFGFKVACWLSELHRDIDRMNEAEDRIFVGQMFGAVGTFASYGDKAFELADLFAQKVGLNPTPDYSGKINKDRVAEAFLIFALIAGLMGRIAKQVFLLMTTEINEVREGRLDTFVGSSAMPQKMNPVNTQHMRGLERQIRYRAFHIMEILTTQDHEGNMDTSNDQQDITEEMCRLMGEMMERAETLISTLTVDVDNMHRNLNMQHGVILSENVMMELGKYIGRQDAHEVVSECATKAQLEHLNFKDVLLAHEAVKGVFTAEQLDDLLDPSKYTGKASEIVKIIVNDNR